MTEAKRATESDEDVSILVLGSSRFSDPEFVHMVLNLIVKTYSVRRIVTGDFAGTDSFARDFAKSNGLAIDEVYISDVNRRLSQKFYSEIGSDSPMKRAMLGRVIRQDKEMKGNIDRLRQKGIQCMILFPGPEGDLGKMGTAVKRLAEEADIGVFDISTFIAPLRGKLEEAASIIINEQAEPEASGAKVSQKVTL